MSTKPVTWVPAELSPIDVAFPASVKALMPAYGDIPEPFRRDGTIWNRLFSDCFFFGVGNLKLTPMPGIDKEKAWRHIWAVMGSFEPKHEHKEAACAYLMSLWFEDGPTWERKEPRDNGRSA